MKRDLDLIRKILLQIESDLYISDIKEYPEKQIAYHVALLEDAKLVTEEIYISLYVPNSELMGIRITWAGHEFLDASRSASIWEKAKMIAIEKVGTLSFEVLKSLLTQLAKEAVAEI